MKLTKKELERVHTCLTNYWNGGFDSKSQDKILTKIEDMISEIITPGSTKLTKYFPIETAPLKQIIHVWGGKVWEPISFGTADTLKCAIQCTNFTHWRPMPKGPK